MDGNVAKIDLAARGVDGALVHFNAPSWAVRAVMSSTTLPVCPKTGSTSPSLTVHLCLTHCSGKSGMRPLETRPASCGGGGDRASWFGFRRATAEDGSVDLSIHSGVWRYVRGVEVVRAEAAGLMEAGWSALRRKSYSWSNPARQRSRLLSLMGTMDAGQVLLPLAGRVGRGIYMPYDCNGFQALLVGHFCSGGDAGYAGL